MSEEHLQNSNGIGEFLPQDLSLEMSICIVTELVDLIFILKTIHNWPNTENECFEYKTLKERFEKTVFHNETAENTLRKENFSFTASLGTTLLEELKKDGVYTDFSKIVYTLQKMKEDEETLLTEAAKKENGVKQLQIILNSEKGTYVNKIVSAMAGIGEIKDKIENFQIETEIKTNYVKSLQKSKIEMSGISFCNAINEKSEKINGTRAKIAQDIRVHKEIGTAMNDMIKELEDKVEEWKRRYDEKLEEMNQKLDVLQTKQNNQLEIISNYKELFAKRQKEIDEYKQYQIEQEKLRLEKQRRNKAATIIQGWWRGTMVRKGFGKFRKKKEKKGKKKSSDKKEKK